MVENPKDRSSRIEAQIISMRQLHFPQIDILNVISIVGMTVLLQFIPLRIYKFCLFQFGRSPNVHSTLRSMNREWFSRRSSTKFPWLHNDVQSQNSHVMPIDKGTHQGKLCMKHSASLK